MAEKIKGHHDFPYKFRKRTSTYRRNYWWHKRMQGLRWMITLLSNNRIITSFLNVTPSRWC